MMYLLLIVGLVLLGEKVWKHLMVVRFFRRPSPLLQRPPVRISILQPILSGDPLLPACLEQNLRLFCRYPREFLWLVDSDDPEGREICGRLMARYPEQDVRLIVLPPPPDGCSPKMVKLLAGIPLARGDVLCVLDNDTALPEGGLETGLPYLDLPGIGLAFGLPYYASFGNLWSCLVAYFVNSHSLLTYVPYTYLAEPFTINGMFYLFRRDIYEAMGGFHGLEKWLADDFAVARHFRAHGFRLAQTPVRHPIRTHVRGLGAYLRLLHRWLVFPRETVMKSLPWRDLVVAYGLALLSTLAPLGFLTALALWPSWELAGLMLLYCGYHYLTFAHFNVAYLNRISPWRWSWLVVVLQLLLPFHILAAVGSRQRVTWRGHVMQVERGGGFRFLRRRTA
jgi:ceramide glucosyltransferase